MVRLQMYSGGKVANRGAEGLSDDELFRLIQSDNESAFGILVKRHQKLVLGLAVRFLGDSVLGRDAAQDVFLSLWAERARYTSQGTFRSYLVSVTLNRCRYLTRQRTSNLKKLGKLKIETDTQAASQSEDVPLEQLLIEEKKRAVKEKLIHLPPVTRKVLILRYTHEMQLDEIAAVTGMPLGTVKSHLARGVRRLYKMLEEK